MLEFLGLLTNRWVQLALAVAVTFAVSYSWGRYTGYSNEHQARLLERSEWEAVVASANTKTERLQEAFDRATNDSSERIKQITTQLVQKENALLKRIKENEELKRITIPRSAVELFNDSARSVEPTTPKEQAVPRVDETPSRTLGDLIDVSARNNLNHQACVAQVSGLQSIICALYRADGQPLDEFEVCTEGQP